MGRHARKRRFRLGIWLTSCVFTGTAIGGVALAEAPSATLSHSAPLPAFTSDPSYPAAQPSVQPPPAAPVYVLQPGDTLSRVALEKCHDVNDWASLQKANRIGNPGAIIPGQRITLDC